jgi:hypothetical protein
MLRRDSSRGNQVKRLVLSMDSENNFEKWKLFELLPKLQYFSVNNDKESDFNDYYNAMFYDPERLESSRYHIEHIVDCGCSEYTFIMLSTGLCPQLTVLKVNLKGESMDTLVGLLEHTPALKKLRIENTKATMTAIEQLHTNASQICLLSIEGSPLIPSALPLSIKPAKRTTSLQLHSALVDIETHTLWLHYIRLKYPNLHQFEFTEHDTALIPSEVERNKMINDGLVPLLISLGTQLKSLALSMVYIESDLFKKIDKCNTKLEQFTSSCFRPKHIISHIIQSNQCSFIQKLKLTNTPFFSMEILKDMVCLKSLKISFESCVSLITTSTINLHRLLEFCPNTLETVGISHAHLNCDATFNHRFHIKKFQFYGPILSKRVERFLSFCLPNLRSLHLFGCVSSGSRLILSNAHFTTLELRLRIFDSCPGVSVFTWDSHLQRHYKIIDYDTYSTDSSTEFMHVDHSLYKGYRRISINEAIPDSSITVECASLQNLIIHGLLAC